MIWALLKKVPKYALVAVVLVVPTVGFAFWCVVDSTKKAILNGHGVPAEDIRPKVALVEAKHERLILVDNDLYDIDGGARIFKNWLKDGMPEKLFYDSSAKKFVAQYERGFVRCGLSGAAEATLAQKFKPAFSDDLKSMVYAKDKDIWRADVDWKEFKLVNEKKLTTIEQFNEQNFADNIFLGTAKTLIVRNLNKVLHVNLETGDVKPMQISLLEIGKRKSPDSKGVVGLENGKFYYYDVDTDAAKYFPVGRGAINDYQWLGNNRCVAIAAMKTVIQYDRIKNTLTEIAALPFPCNKIGEPSPDGRFVFCLSTVNGKGVLVDLEKKTVTPVTGGAGVSWVSNDTFAFSRETPDSDLRGIWLQTAGEGERRISTEPYLVSKAGGELMTVKSVGLLIFATKHGLSKMKPDGAELAEFVKLDHPPTRALGIEEWKVR